MAYHPIIKKEEGELLAKGAIAPSAFTQMYLLFLSTLVVYDHYSFLSDLIVYTHTYFSDADYKTGTITYSTR